MVLTVEPLIGAFVGWAAGVSAVPHARTYLGGVVLMGSTLLVVKCEAARKEREAAEGGGAGEGIELAGVAAAEAEPSEAVVAGSEREEGKRTPEDGHAEV